jgi:predicted YcjX-like family ATPase
MRRIKKIDIPAEMPKPDYFERRAGIRTPRFVPPEIKGGGRYGIPNVQLGEALNKLVGDLL